MNPKQPVLLIEIVGNQTTFSETTQLNYLDRINLWVQRGLSLCKLQKIEKKRKYMQLGIQAK